MVQFVSTDSVFFNLFMGYLEITRDRTVIVLKIWLKISGFGLSFSNFVEDF